MHGASHGTAEVVTHRRVLAIALPMTLAHLTTPLLGLANTAVVGRLGDAALLGGVALGAVIFDMLFWMFGFLRMGTVGLVAQALGRRDAQEQCAVLLRALLFAGLCGLVMVLLQLPLLWLSLHLAGASPEVNAAVADYFHVRIFAAPFTLANYVVLGWLTGLGRIGLALLVQAGMNALNMALSAFLVLGLGMGVVGAGAGALVAEAAGTVAGLFICARLLGFSLAVPRDVLLDKARLASTFMLNGDIMIRTAALMFTFAFFAGQGARAGDATLAANGLLQNMGLLAVYFLDGFATAAEQICGSAAGARRRAPFMRGIRLIILWGFGCALLAFVLFMLAGPWVIDLMTTSAEVRVEASNFLLYAALLPLAGVLAFVLDGVFIGALWSRDMRNMMLAAVAIYLLLWWSLRAWENHGLWLAMLGLFLARGGLLALRLPVLARRTFTSPE